ncbi:MAG: D-alanyl-D-alanine carboxypeptidase [Clostridia bacterium]|nr:D-alanyl-D-alanine carboxypeptidase [Clostridia bacterium]
MKKVIIFISILVLILTTAVIPANAQDYSSYVELNCEIDYMISLDDGSVVISKNAQKKAAPASMTKITTALVVLQNCPDLNETVTVSQNAVDALKGTGSSLSGLKVGEQMSLLDMLHCLLVPSGNDAAVVLAEHVAGSQAKFVQMMNDCVKKLGCKNTHYDNPHGLDSETHYSTAEDIAIIAKAALEHNAFKNIVSEPKYTLKATNMNKERTLINTNFLINPVYVTYYRSFVKGIKTGHTEDSGYCVSTYASKDGYNYLAVAMNGDYRDSDKDNIEENQSFMDTIRMYEWAFANLSYELVAPKNMMVSEVGVNYSWKTDYVQLKPKDDFRTLVPTGTDEGSVLIEPIDKPETVDAPIKAGDVACKAKVIYADTEIATIDLVYSQSVGKNYLLYGWSLLMRLFSSTIFKILFALAVIGVIVYIALVMRSNAVRKKKKNQLRIVKINDMEKTQNTKKQDRNYKPKH